jgi:hypothetical protein
LDASKAKQSAGVTGRAVLIRAVYRLQMFLMQQHVIFPRNMNPSSQPPDFKTQRMQPWRLEISAGRCDARCLPSATEMAAVGWSRLRSSPFAGCREIFWKRQPNHHLSGSAELVDQVRSPIPGSKHTAVSMISEISPKGRVIVDL